MTDEYRKVSILDLTWDQTEALEIELGKPFDEWSELPSRLGLMRRVYAMVTGLDPSIVGGFTLRQLGDRVDLATAEPEVTEAGNPTDPPST